MLDLYIETEREDDGRWIADAVDMPGVMAYGQTEAEAIENVTALATQVVRERDEP